MAWSRVCTWGVGREVESEGGVAAAISQNKAPSIPCYTLPFRQGLFVKAETGRPLKPTCPVTPLISMADLQGAMGN